MVPQVYVIIPAFNEETTIGTVVAEILKLGHIALVIDDYSKDNTGTIARSNGAIVLKHHLNRGQGAAIETGLEYCRRKDVQFALTFDADGQHQSKDIEKILAPLLSGEFDIALGSRFLSSAPKHIPWFRREVLRFAILFTRFFSRIEITDTHNGFRGLSRKAIEKISLKEDGMAHASELYDQIMRHQLKYVEVPVDIIYNEHTLAKGQSSSNMFRIALNYLVGKFIK